MQFNYNAINIGGLWFIPLSGHDCGIIAILSYTNEQLQTIDSATRFHGKYEVAEIWHKRYLALYDFCSKSRACLGCSGMACASWHYVQIYM